MIGVSVIIPTFRRQKTLRDLLGSIERQLSEVAFEVIVVANLPEVGLKKKVESYGPHFRFHETGRLGVNIARNKGLDLAKGRIVLFLDDDTYLTDREFIQKHYLAHEKYPGAIAIGGPYSPKAAMTTVETAYHWILEHHLNSVRLERDEARLLAAGNASFKRERLEARHRFDDRVVTGASEESFFASLRREQNIFLLLGSLVVEHRCSVGPLELMRKAFDQGYGQTLTSLDSSYVLDRPHWNSVRTICETLRAGHVDQSVRFRVAMRAYDLLFNYGVQLATRDAVPMVATTAIKAVPRTRSEFSIWKIALAFISRNRLSPLKEWARSQTLALRSAFQD